MLFHHSKSQECSIEDDECSNHDYVDIFLSESESVDSEVNESVSKDEGDGDNDEPCWTLDDAPVESIAEAILTQINADKERNLNPEQ